MSIHSQIAFGKNFTLQKQLDDKFFNLRRMFKHSRRRLDTMEEECVAALYKLLLYAREKQGLTDIGETNIFNDLFRRSKSAGAKRSQSALGAPKTDDNSPELRRPATAMSAKTYTQSYSFMKDGLNIGKTRHDRFLRTKADRERQQESIFKIERMKDDWKNSGLDRPMTAVEPVGSSTDDEENNKALLVRPKTAGPQSNSRGLLSRPRTKNSLILHQESVQMTTPNTATASLTRGTLEDTHNLEDEHQRSAHVKKSQTPCLKTVHENRTRLDGANSPLVVRITTTRLKDVTDDERTAEKAINVRTESRTDNTAEDDLISLNEEDKHQLNELINDSYNDNFKQNTSNCRSATASVLPSSRNAQTPNSTLEGGSLLRKSTERAQAFLTQYSKKSRVFGYVVKTRSSIVAPRERIVTHRSPCITYQELASIKASIKQHESRTKSLLHRSAKISTYVDKLARAGEIRQRLQDMKENRNTE